MVSEPSFSYFGTRFADGEQFGGTVRVTETHALQRTGEAVIAERGRTMESAELHDSGVEEARVSMVKECLYLLVKEFLARRSVKGLVYIQQTCHYPIDIPIHSRIRLVIGERRNSPRGIITDTRQRADVLKTGREGRPTVGNNHLRGFMQIARP